MDEAPSSNVSKSMKTDRNCDQDECLIFGELVACEMWKLDKQTQGEVEMAIDRHDCGNEKKG